MGPWVLQAQPLVVCSQAPLVLALLPGAASHSPLLQPHLTFVKPPLVQSISKDFHSFYFFCSIIMSASSYSNRNTECFFPWLSCFHEKEDSFCCVCIESCLTLCDAMDCSLPGFSVHGILQARIMDLVAHFLLQGIFLTQGWNTYLLHLLHMGSLSSCWALLLS